PVFAENNLCGGRCFYGDDMFTAVVEGDYPLRIDYTVSQPRIRAVLAPLFIDRPQAAIGRLLRPLLQSFLMPFLGLKAVHAATVAGAGAATLLIGAGGAGKTTTAIALALDRCALLSDDGPLITMRGGEAVVLSSLDYAHATSGTLELFPKLGPHVVGDA